MENKQRSTIETRNLCLKTAATYVSKDRIGVHGEPEDSFGNIAQLWSAYLGVPVSPSQVCVMMILLKIARTKNNPANFDNWIDIAGYSACAAGIECAGE